VKKDRFRRGDPGTTIGAEIEGYCQGEVREMSLVFLNFVVVYFLKKFVAAVLTACGEVRPRRGHGERREAADVAASVWYTGGS
jgi:hypothetical protein